MKTPAHRRTVNPPRDAGYRPEPGPAKVLPSDPDPVANAVREPETPRPKPAATGAKRAAK